MHDHEPRPFADDESIRRLGEGMLARRLAKSEWTHEAHLATCAWLVLERPDIVPERDLPDLIRRYNESVGGVNDSTQGYHETITQVSIGGVERVNVLLSDPEGCRDWSLRFYSRERLFSAEARLGWVEPDLAPLPDNKCHPVMSLDPAPRGPGSPRSAVP